jgi:hypothetical protein
MILTDYILNQWKNAGRITGKEFIGSTIVTSDVFFDLAEQYGVDCKVGLTGFKWIGKMIHDFEGKEKFICGGEESFGFMTGDFVRDKDSVLFIDQYRETDKVRWMSADSARERLEEAVKDSDSSPQSALSAKGGLDVILRDQNSMLELATYFQRGLHSGLDIISDPDVLLYDSLLTSFLHDRNINLPHRLLHLHKGSKWDSTILYIDTLVNIGTPGYVPTSKAVEYNYSFDINTSQSYRLIMEPVGMLVLRQMSGILTTSFIISSSVFCFKMVRIKNQKEKASTIRITNDVVRMPDICRKTNMPAGSMMRR